MKAQEMEYTPLLIYQFFIYLDTYIVVPVSNVNILLGCQLFSITIMNRSIRNRHRQGGPLICLFAWVMDPSRDLEAGSQPIARQKSEEKRGRQRARRIAAAFMLPGCCFLTLDALASPDRLLGCGIKGSRPCSSFCFFASYHPCIMHNRSHSCMK